LFLEVMHMKKVISGGLVSLFVAVLAAVPSSAAVRGRYVEVRTADIYTGPCFASSQVGLAGRRAILAWDIRQGTWQGTDLSGLHAVVVVRAKDNLGDPYHNPYPAQAVLIVDQRATPAQAQALESFVRAVGGPLAKNVVLVDRAPIRMEFGSGVNNGRVTVQAGELAEIRTRHLRMSDCICGNEFCYYPPLTKVAHAMPAYTLDQAYSGTSLGAVWSQHDSRSAYIGTFNTAAAVHGKGA
jgi:hypothetical protein